MVAPLAGAAAGLMLLSAAVVAADVGLLAVGGDAGCLGPSSTHYSCTPVRGAARTPYAVAVSPEGRNVYVVGQRGTVGVVNVFARNRRTDALRQLPGAQGCAGMVAGCTPASLSYLFDAQSTAQAIVVSPDGRNVYAASGSIVAFSRDPATGALTQLAGAQGCIQASASVNGCTPARSLIAQALAVSSDGRSIYAAGGSTASAFSRDPANGALTQVSGSGGCANADGSQGCARVAVLENAPGAAVSPDGRDVYVASPGGASSNEGSLVVFARDPSTSAITQLAGRAGCLATAVTAQNTTCQVSPFAEGPQSVIVSRDGRNVYTASSLPGPPSAVVEFARNSSPGSLSALPGHGCLGGLTHTRCDKARLMSPAVSIAIDSDGRRVYVGSYPGVFAGSTGYSNGRGQVTVFGRAKRTGVLRQLRGTAGCVTDDARHLQGCGFAPQLSAGAGLAVSPDGDAVYASGTVLGILVRPNLAIAHTPITVPSSGRVRVRLSCLPDSGRCVGRMTLTSAHALRLGAHRRFLSLGGATFSIDAGKSSALLLRVPSGGRQALLARHVHRLYVLLKATASRNGHTHTTQAVVLLTVLN